MPEDEKQNLRFSISLREDVVEKIKEIQRITGLDRSAAISLCVQLFDMRRLDPSSDRSKQE